MNDTYVHPQETWTETKCKQAAAHAPADHWGNKPPKGLINADSSPYPRYGQTRTFNGGRVINGKWYQSERVPYPIIPDTYEIVHLSSWGDRIQLKTPAV